MFSRNKVTFHSYILLICLCLIPLHGYAGIYIETELVSGTVTSVRDGAIELDGNGISYYPASQRIEVDLKIGSVVTLRYYVDNSGEPVNKIVEYALGRDSLAQWEPPVEDKELN
ncbi:MAG: hypothetical protein VR64_15760 [Desulfatitalea sp. BRH_c12]|nr:MAG: hypothetical protein VR64_15760 [Desulfatitalea sp. BRH_c12]